MNLIVKINYKYYIYIYIYYCNVFKMYNYILNNKVGFKND